MAHYLISEAQNKKILDSMHDYFLTRVNSVSYKFQILTNHAQQKKNLIGSTYICEHLISQDECGEGLTIQKFT